MKNQAISTIIQQICNFQIYCKYLGDAIRMKKSNHINGQGSPIW